MAKFLSDLDVVCINDGCWKLDAPLRYESDMVGVVEVPKGFETDFASVPRVPIAYTLFGDRAHMESVLHDFLYRIDAVPPATREEADKVFLEAMKVRGKSWAVRSAMYAGVRLGGWTAYHKKKVADTL